VEGQAVKRHIYGDTWDTRRRAARAGLLRKGSLVRLDSAQGLIDRVVVRVTPSVVMVCRPEEYEAAIREGRAPNAIGFRVSDIVEPRWVRD
jgi:hypothetical protein